LIKCLRPSLNSTATSLSVLRLVKSAHFTLQVSVPHAFPINYVRLLLLAPVCVWLHETTQFWLD
jgi:hypothetical protein